MLEWLEHAMPHAAAYPFDPVFQYEVRRIRWGQSAQQLKRYTLARFLIVQLVILSLWLLLVASVSNGTPRFAAVNASSDFIGVLLLTSVGANILLDVASIVIAFTRTSVEASAGRWNLILLSNVSAEQFVASKHHLAQVRVWRIMNVVLSTRISVFVLLFSHTVVLASRVAEWGFMRWLLVSLCVVLPLFAVIALVSAPFVIEPFWRMRALTAVGIALAAKIHHMGLALLAAGLVIVAVWLVQSVIVLVIFGWIGGGSPNAIVPLLISFGPLLFIIMGFAFHTLCKQLQKRALRYAARHAFAQE